MSDVATKKPLLKSNHSSAGVESRRQMNRRNKMLTGWSAHNGIRLTVTRRGITIEGQSRAARFSGTAYAPNGEKTTGLKSDPTKPWVKFDANTNAYFSGMAKRWLKRKGFKAKNSVHGGAEFSSRLLLPAAARRGF